MAGEEKVMISLPLEVIENVLADISRGHDFTDNSFELLELVTKFKKDEKEKVQ